MMFTWCSDINFTLEKDDAECSDINFTLEKDDAEFKKVMVNDFRYLGGTVNRIDVDGRVYETPQLLKAVYPRRRTFS